VKDAAQNVAEDVPQDVAQDSAFGSRAARAPAAATAVFMQLVLRCGRNWAVQWHFARAVGKRFRGCRAKRLFIYQWNPSVFFIDARGARFSKPLQFMYSSLLDGVETWDFG